MAIGSYEELREIVAREVGSVAITDVHTHIYPAAFGDLLLWGIDELLTYHYLVAEYFRYSPMDYAEFFKLSKRQQADLIWQTLFIERSPISEAQRGVLTVLNTLGLPVGTRDLESYRRYFSALTAGEYVDLVFKIAGVKQVVMTNDVFDAAEKEIWERLGNSDPRFKAALRLDGLLNGYEDACGKLAAWGYQVGRELDEASIREVKRFLTEWSRKIGAVYMAVSLPPSFQMKEDSARAKLIEACVLPICRELGIPFAMMIGVNKLVNKDLGLAGDSLGKADIGVLEYLCNKFPHNKFMVTMLSREDQHELAITARKFRNLLVFGCWWFLNNPSIVEEITTVRVETLGLSFVPQHSDARVLDHLVYKWAHSRKTIAKVLTAKYADTLATGWTLTEAEIRRDVEALFSDNFRAFAG
ncbi:MAG: glucuronate isomerase [Negativicutes bacterium]|nr:glucuronate isomerase [Negativicutes bacterium]